MYVLIGCTIAPTTSTLVTLVTIDTSFLRFRIPHRRRRLRYALHLFLRFILSVNATIHRVLFCPIYTLHTRSLRSLTHAKKKEQFGFSTV